MGNKNQLVCLFYEDEIMIGENVKLEDNFVSFSILNAYHTEESVTFKKPEIVVSVFWGNEPDSFADNLEDIEQIDAHMTEDWEFVSFKRTRGNRVEAVFTCTKVSWEFKYLESISFTLGNISGSGKEGRAYVGIEFYGNSIQSESDYKWELYIKKVPMGLNEV